MNNETYRAICAYKAGQDNWLRLKHEAEEERSRLFDLWKAVIREFCGDGEKAVDAVKDFEKEQMKCKTKQSSDDTSECESTG